MALRWSVIADEKIAEIVVHSYIFNKMSVSRFLHWKKKKQTISSPWKLGEDAFLISTDCGPYKEKPWRESTKDIKILSAVREE